MRRFLDYYRQFDELSPEEVARELRERRDAERRRHPAEQPRLDLSGAAWPSPPHPDLVNEATFALRRSVNDYADARPLREALAAAHNVEPERIVVGHGAAELLRAALRALTGPGDQVAIAWPGWGLLPGIVHEAGAAPVPVAFERLAEALGAVEPPSQIAPAVDAARLRAVVLTRPCDPTGEVAPLELVRAVAAALPGNAWLILDEALAGFLPDGEDGLIEHPRVVHVRSFSKAHAMAGFRIGYTIVPAGAELPLAPLLGVSAPALAGALWAVRHGGPSAQRRRARTAAERERLAAGSPFQLAPGHGPYAWMAAPEGLVEALAARRIFVAPGSAWGDPRHVRITLRDEQATERLLAALAEIADR
jgi:histidinol-phosphate aminotransferase